MKKTLLPHAELWLVFCGSAIFSPRMARSSVLGATFPAESDDELVVAELTETAKARKLSFPLSSEAADLRTAERALHTLANELLPSMTWAAVGSRTTGLSTRASDCDIVVWPASDGSEEGTDTTDALQAALGGRVDILKLEAARVRRRKQLKKTKTKKLKKMVEKEFSESINALVSAAVRKYGFETIRLSKSAGLVSLSHCDTGVKCDLLNGCGTTAATTPSAVAAHVSAVRAAVAASEPAVAVVHMALREAMAVPKLMPARENGGSTGGLSGYVLWVLVARCGVWQSSPGGGGGGGVMPPSAGAALLAVCDELALRRGGACELAPAAAGAEWACTSCGWRNRATNKLCGGLSGGVYGCGEPGPRLGGAGGLVKGRKVPAETIPGVHGGGLPVTTSARKVMAHKCV